MTDRPGSAISILLPNLRGGGAERLKMELAHAFVRRGHRVEFALMTAEGDLLHEAEAAFSVVELGMQRARHLPGALARYLRRRRPDALLAAMWPLTAIAGLSRMLSGHRCRVVVSEHCNLTARYSRASRLHRAALHLGAPLGYRLVDARVAVSTGVAEDMAALARLPLGSIEVIHNPVATRPVPPAAELARAEALWGAPAGARILSVGRLAPQKNHPLLLRAFARGFSGSSARLMCLGKGPDEAALRALAAELGIEGQVTFAGFQPDPTPFYTTADLFSLSSDYEGFGNVIAEALACGTPVVSTDCPSGPSEILAGGVYGTLVPVGDEAALAAAMQAALKAGHDPDRLRERGADFTPDKAAGRYLDLLCGPPGSGG